MLALKHGARRVVAFESDPDRFLLGQTIIENLDLTDQIELRHMRYDHTMAAEFPGWTFVTETVNGNLWQEGIWNSLPRQRTPHFVPWMLGVEFFATPIPDSFAFALGSEPANRAQFAPGVDVDPAFVQEVNIQMRAGTVDSVIDPGPGLIEFDHEVDTVWGWVPYMRCFNQQSKPCAQYYLSVNQCSWWSPWGMNGPVDFDQRHYELTLDLPQDCAVLVVPRAVIMHGEHSLYLDMGHWGPTQKPIIVNRCPGPVTVKQDLHTGAISYHQED